VDNDQLLAYTKRAGGDVVLAVVSLDPRKPQAGVVDLAPDSLPSDEPMELSDVLSGATQTWHAGPNRIEINPAVCTATLWVAKPATAAGT
jgi:starch synthase (maltosyl-transferring)